MMKVRHPFPQMTVVVLIDMSSKEADALLVVGCRSRTVEAGRRARTFSVT